MSYAQRAYEKDRDRSTRRHFDKKRAEGPYYGILLKASKPEISDLVAEQVRSAVQDKFIVHTRDDRVFLAGPLKPSIVQAIRRYVSGNADVVESKAIRAPYEFFPANPLHLLERLLQYTTINRIFPEENSP